MTFILSSLFITDCAIINYGPADFNSFTGNSVILRYTTATFIGVGTGGGAEGAFAPPPILGVMCLK